MTYVIYYKLFCHLQELGNETARGMEPPDAKESNPTTDISPAAGTETSTAPFLPQILPKPLHTLWEPPELKVGTACSHTEKGAKDQQHQRNSRSYQKQGIPSAALARWSLGEDHTSSTPLRKTSVCLPGSAGWEKPTDAKVLSETPEGSGLAVLQCHGRPQPSLSHILTCLKLQSHQGWDFCRKILKQLLQQAINECEHFSGILRARGVSADGQKETVPWGAGG